MTLSMGGRSLLNFLLPEVFDDVDQFLRWFDFDGVGDKVVDNRIMEAEQEDQIVSKLYRAFVPPNAQGCDLS